MIDYFGAKVWVTFNGRILRQPKVSYNHQKIVNVYEFGTSNSHSDDHTLKNCLFGAVTLTKHADIDKYGYSGYGIGFDRKSSFLFPGGGFGQNVLTFGIDMSSSVHVDSEKKDILDPVKGPPQGLEHTLIAKMYSINFTVTKKTFCLSLNYNGANSCLFGNVTEIHKFKAKDSDIVATPLCLGNILKHWWSINNMKRTGFDGYVHDFSVDYDATAVDDILDIHNYLMKKMT